MRTIDIWISECPECKKIYVGNTMKQAYNICKRHTETKHLSNKRPKIKKATLMLID